MTRNSELFPNYQSTLEHCFYGNFENVIIIKQTFVVAKSTEKEVTSNANL